MLSTQSSIKLQTLIAPLTGLALDDIQETLNEVKELCELPDPDQEENSDGTHSVDELLKKLGVATEDLDIPIDFTDLLQYDGIYLN